MCRIQNVIDLDDWKQVCVCLLAVGLFIVCHFSSMFMIINVEHK